MSRPTPPGGAAPAPAVIAPDLWAEVLPEPCRGCRAPSGDYCSHTREDLGSRHRGDLIGRPTRIPHAVRINDARRRARGEHVPSHQPPAIPEPRPAPALEEHAPDPHAPPVGWHGEPDDPGPQEPEPYDD